MTNINQMNENTLEQVLSTDLNAITQVIGKTFMDAYLLQHGPLKDGTPVVLGGFEVNGTSGMTVTIGEGIGAYLDNTHGNQDESRLRLVQIEPNSADALAGMNVTLEPNTSSFSRIDVVYATQAVENAQNENRNKYNPATGAFTAESVPKRKKVSCTLNVEPGASGTTSIHDKWLPCIRHKTGASLCPGLPLFAILLPSGSFEINPENIIDLRFFMAPNGYDTGWVSETELLQADEDGSGGETNIACSPGKAKVLGQPFTIGSADAFAAWTSDLTVRFSLASRLNTVSNRDNRTVYYYAGVVGMPYAKPDDLGNRKGLLYAANNSAGHTVTHDEDGLLNLDDEFVEIQLDTDHFYTVHAPMLFVEKLQCAVDGTTLLSLENHGTIRQRFNELLTTPFWRFTLLYEGVGMGHAKIRKYGVTASPSGNASRQAILITHNASVTLVDGVDTWTRDIDAVSYMVGFMGGFYISICPENAMTFTGNDWVELSFTGDLGSIGVGTRINGSGDDGWQAVKDHNRACLRPNTNQKGWLGDATHRLERVYTEGLRGPGAADGGVMDIGAGTALGLEVVEDSVENSTTIRPRYDGSGDLGDFAHRFYRAYAANVHTSAVYLGSPGVPGPKITYGAGDPSGATLAGSLYIRTNPVQLHMYDGSVWKQLAFTA